MKLRIAGISLEINFRFVAVLTILLTVIPENSVVYCFAFCILHELGHLSVMLLCKKKICGISFDYFGIKIITGKNFLPPLKEAAIAAGGPCANLFLASVLFICGKQTPALLNLTLAFFNLLPVSILDGGHILTALFPESKALKSLFLIFAVIILIAGIGVAVYSEKNFTLLIVSLYLLIGTVCSKD